MEGRLLARARARQEQLRSENRAEESRRRAEVYARLPEIRSLDQSIRGVMVELTGLVLGKSGRTVAELEAESLSLQEKRAALLRENGYGEDYLDPIYTCSRCMDTGYIGTVKCDCFKKREMELLYRESNLKNMAGGYTFEDFDLSLYSEYEIDKRTGKSARDYAVSALAAAKEFTENFDTVKGNLFIYGNTGLGKTMLSTCIASSLINTTHSVVYITATELFSKLNTFDENVESSPILECDLLIIDDLGTEYFSDVSASKLFYCLNERLLRGRSCVISTNLDLVKLRDRYSERIFSRIISSYKVIKLYGQDIRTAKLFG